MLLLHKIKEIKEKKVLKNERMEKNITNKNLSARANNHVENV